MRELTSVREQLIASGHIRPRPELSNSPAPSQPVLKIGETKWEHQIRLAERPRFAWERG